MDWVERMNSAITYIEENLEDSPDLNEAARRACCSPWHFQRMFAYLAEIPLSEYIRRRRLTLAALELQQSTLSLVDIAVKYGYDSREAFTRAFKALHGISPSAARSRGAVRKAYPPIRFHITIRGDQQMQYRMEELGPVTIIGCTHPVHTQNSTPEIVELWKNAMAENLFEKLWELRTPNDALRGILGVCANGNWGKNESFDYTLGIVSDTLPPGMSRVDIPAATWVVFTAPGAPDALADCWRQLYTDWVPASAAVYDLAWLPAIECYLPIEEQKNELWIPVVRRAL